MAKKEFNIEIEIPEGIECSFKNGVLTCNKGENEIKKEMFIPRIELKVDGNKIVFLCKKANKKDISIIKTNASHIKNIFKGLEENFTYELEICNVHFPMTVKVDGTNVIISNFLGEKMNRFAKILDGVKVDIKGNKITVTGNDIEKTGQTAANIEKSAKVTNKDRRVFQDGIFMTNKPGGEI